MAKCIHCHQKKGKRNCNALNGDICNLCCGRHREKDIRCPTSCQFLGNKQNYYIQKSEDDFYEYTVNFFQNIYRKNKEAGKHFLVFLDTKLYEQFYSNPNTKDNEIISLLNALRAKLSPIQLVIQHESASTCSAWDSINEYIDHIGLNEENALKMVDSYITQIKDYIANDADPDKWIRQFLNLMETKNAEMCKQVKSKKPIDKNIIYPGNRFEDMEMIKKSDKIKGGSIIIP